ncbi:DUF6164 family protein [Marinomonas sp. 2405UD68-3]|uniref:DUF6164 family protein n=1 Tax=Marinomonas sp. 2405UD68-3 TaxID=3391835 RepID=UPI0039C92CFD
MAKLVFALKYVPEEEAATIRQILIDNDIDFYETSAGRWQISLAAIWVRNNADFESARALIVQDQIARQQYFKEQKLPFGPAMAAYLKENPVEFAVTLVAIVFVAGLSVFPFFITI